MNIYVGNLSRETAEQDLRQAFEAFGQVTKATVITDKFSGESRGFGFVEMADKTQGMAAITGMNGKELHGRTLNVSEARPREDHGGGGGRGGRDGQRRPQGGGGGARKPSAKALDRSQQHPAGGEGHPPAAHPDNRPPRRDGGPRDNRPPQAKPEANKTDRKEENK